MRCGRCAGLKVEELLCDGGMRAIAYRCVHCGDVSDDKILSHRKRHVPPKPNRTRTPVFEEYRWITTTSLQRLRT